MPFPSNPCTWAWHRHRGRAAEFGRFVLVGLTNTGVGYGVYLLLLTSIGYEAAYAAAYLVGVVVAYVLNSNFVFRSRMLLRTALRYPLIYAVQYLFGALLLYALVNWTGIDRRWAALLALALSVPASFVLNRLVLVSSQRV